MFGLKLVTVSCFVLLVTAQDYQDYGVGRQQHRLSPNVAADVDTRPTPVPILKQINKHNEDGSYTYGYEGADGSFKIETKLATGEVKGKYGYVDETGKVRIVEYGANKYGFQPSGDGITVAPPTLVDETTNKNRNSDYEEEQPRPYIARVQRPQLPQRNIAPAPTRTQYSDEDYDEEQSNRYNNPQPQQPQQPQYHVPQPQPQPQPQQHQQQQYSAPTPPRAQIPNAVPIDVVYSARQRPARPDPEYSQKQLFTAGPSQGSVRLSQPQAIQYQPAPIPRPQPQAQLHHQQHQQQQQPQQQTSYVAPRLQSQQQSQGRSTSVLDQLAKDYALPAGGSTPLHDISFGYY